MTSPSGIHSGRPPSRYMQSAAQRADDALRKWLTLNGSPRPEDLDWQDYEKMVSVIAGAMGSMPVPQRFCYEHPVTLQDSETGVGKPYKMNLAWFDSEGGGRPVVAVGGLTNVSQRFDFLALDVFPALSVIGLDLAGRGGSGWMAEISDYHLDTYVEQLRQFLKAHKLRDATVLGSSLGGAAAIRLAARHRNLVARIILNDTGPFIPASRRSRRARAVARHYVFSSPAEMFRRTGAAAKYTGLGPDAVLLHNSHHKTRWSPEENGRVYRHDLRALMAYRAEATDDLDLWSDWNRVTCPVLLVHGMLSDATEEESVERMRRQGKVSVIRVPDTGHTPLLCDRGLAMEIADWVQNDRIYDSDRVCLPPSSPDRILYATVH